MSKEYIEREALCKYYQERFEFLKDNSYTMVCGGYMVDEKIQTGAIIAKEFLDRARRTPAADVVKVIRCKDCEHFSKEASKSYDGHFCEVWLDYIKPNDFCSYGKRKTN